MSRAETGSGAVTLKGLARRDAGAPPPYGYDEFQQRHRDVRRRGRMLALASAASVTVVAVLVGLGLREAPPAALAGAGPALLAAPSVPDASAAGEPALVEVDRYGLRMDLEDRIAWFDAALSVGRAESLPDHDLKHLQATREQLARSLQQVSYAHAVLDL